MRRRVEDALGNTPVVLRYAVIGAVLAGVPGAAIGLAVGLVTYPPTAWFAVLELGLPVAMVGFVIGMLVGAAENTTSWFVEHKQKPAERKG